MQDEGSIDLDVLKKVESLVKSGLTLIAPRPGKAAGLARYPDFDGQVEAIAKRMWGKIDGTVITENSYGKGRVIWGQDINDVLSRMNVKPDLVFTSNDETTGLDYIHRTTKTQEIYFVVNRHARKGIQRF